VPGACGFIWVDTRVVATSAEASYLAPFDGNPSNGARLGAFASPADKFIWAVNVGVVAGDVSDRSQAPPAGGSRCEVATPRCGTS
jgi:hypothetical protein